MVKIEIVSYRVQRTKDLFKHSEIYHQPFVLNNGK